MSGLAILKAGSILLAFAGGGAATLAFYWNRSIQDGDEKQRRVRATYFVSYIAMSLSVFFLALHGLLS